MIFIIKEYYLLLISVLIPTYKPNWYIDECFKSLERQSLSKRKFKVYIVLNGPKQDYLNFINYKLKDCNFQFELFYTKEAGVSNARNILLQKSIEPFIVFLDDDDILSKHYLKNLLEVTDEEYMGISNIINFEKNINNTNANYIGKTFNKISFTETCKIKTRKYYSSPMGKMLHRKMILGQKFNTDISIGEDGLFMANISSNIKGVKKSSDNTIYYVRERLGSLTRTERPKVKEIKRLTFLLFLYSKMLFSSDTEKLFVTTRILATLRHLGKALN